MYQKVVRGTMYQKVVRGFSSPFFCSSTMYQFLLVAKSGAWTMYQKVVRISILRFF
jgi:hypothetical protein